MLRRWLVTHSTCPHASDFLGKAVRLQSQSQRQEVTGLVTNRRANVDRRFVREIRAMLHSWRVKGLDDCQKHYEAQYLGRRHRHPGAPAPPFIWVVKGKIEFLGMVRGKEDELYRKLMRQLATLSPELVALPFLQDETDRLLQHLWVVWVDFDDGSITQQGTGFFLEGVGMVTCSHVLGKSKGITIRIESGDGKRQFPARVLHRDATLDVAVLDVTFSPAAALRPSKSKVTRKAQVALLGFPNHNVGDGGSIFDGKVTSFRTDPISGERLILIDAPII